MNGLLMGALVALSMAQQTDTILPLGGATRLDVEASGGSIVVGTWDRDEIQVRAQHSTRTFISIERSRNGTIQIESDANRGPAGIADFEITVPRALALDLEGMYTDITVEGANGEIEAETLAGDVIIRGGRGTVRVSATTGDVLIEGAEGDIEVETAAGDIRFVDVGGNVVAESAGGSIFFTDSRAARVDAGTTGGSLRYQGSFQTGGQYFFGSHGGSVVLVVPEGTSATFNVATIHGSIVSNLDGTTQRMERGQRNAISIGTGGAVVEVETFGGRIALMRAGTEGGLEQ